MNEYFYQPVVDTFDIRICIAKSNCHTVDFLKAHETDLHTISIPLKFSITQTDVIHGLAFWFDVAFLGSQKPVWLSTSPTQPLTHWYQVRCLVNNPLFVEKGDTVSGKVVLVSNKRQSYNVDIELQLDRSPSTKASNSLDLKNPYFRYTGQPVQAPPGCNTTSPSEDYWVQMDQQQNQQPPAQTMQLINGVNGQVIQTNGLVLNNAPSSSDSILMTNSGQPLEVQQHFTNANNVLLNANSASAHQFQSNCGLTQVGPPFTLVQNGQVLGVANQQQQSTPIVASNNLSNFSMNSGLVGGYGAPIDGSVQSIPSAYRSMH